MKITSEKIKEVAERYGLKTYHTEDKEKAGFYIGDKKVEVEEIFSDIKLD